MSRKKILNTCREIWKLKLLEMLLVKLTKNKMYGTFFTKLPPNHYQYKKGTVRKVEIDGVRYELDISDIMDWYIYFGFKDVARAKLFDITNKGEVIIDVGANIGGTTLNFAKIVGPRGKVYSFEPDPINYKTIKTNVNLNTFENIVLNNLGLGNVAGSFKIFTVDENNKGMNRIVGNKFSGDDYRGIRVITLDAYFKENDIQSVDLIKIDVEGFEFNVLKGAIEVVKKFHPKFFIELDDSNLREQKSSAKELVEYLIENKYEIYNAESNEKVLLEQDFANCHYDIVAR